jgi:hypothetical protein
VISFVQGGAALIALALLGVDGLALNFVFVFGGQRMSTNAKMMIVVSVNLIFNLDKDGRKTGEVKNKVEGIWLASQFH